MIFDHLISNRQSLHKLNKRGGWNKHGGVAKVAKSINLEVGITMEVENFFDKSINMEGAFVRGG